MPTFELRTFKDIVDAVAETVKIQSGDTTTLNRIRRDVNISYQEVVGFRRWEWLRKTFDVSTEAPYFVGDSSVVSGSPTVTVTTAPAESRAGYYFTTAEYDEVYLIKAHEPGSTTLELETDYQGLTNTVADFLIWKDWVPIPPDVRETQLVTTDFSPVPVEPLGWSDFRRTVLANGRGSEGAPQFYSTSGPEDTAPYSTISGIPAVATRASTGYIRTLIFDSDVSALLSAGDQIRVTGSGSAAYNGTFTVRSVSTTTITYVAPTIRRETATAAVATLVQDVNQEEAVERVRRLHIFPSLQEGKTTLHIDAVKDARTLIEDGDEPLVPLQDRIVLYYLTAAKAWRRERNETQSQLNEQLGRDKLNTMLGHIEDSFAAPLLEPSKDYLRIKRMRRTRHAHRRS